MASNSDDDLQAAKRPGRRPTQRLRHRAGRGTASRVSAMAELVLCAAVAMLTGVICAWMPVAPAHALAEPQNCPGFPQEEGTYNLWQSAPFVLEKLDSAGSVSLQEMETAWTRFDNAGYSDEHNNSTTATDGFTLLSTIDDVSSDSSGTHVITVNRFYLTVTESP